MERRGAPVGGRAENSVVVEAGEFGPERDALPEIRVDGHREREGREAAGDTRADDES